MAGIKDYSTTQASNTSLNSINVGEGMLPSNLNNAIRALMKNTRDWYNDSQWVEYGDGSGAYTAAYASATSFTIAGVDVTSVYHTGRRIKLTATTPGTIYGTISSSSFSTNTTVNVTWDSGSLSNETIDNVYVAALSKTNDSIPESTITNAKVASSAAIDATKIHDGTISNTEFGYLNGVTSAIQTQLDAKLTASNNLSDLGAASTARTNLGLGTIATQNANSVAITGGSVTGMSAPSTGSDVTTKTYVDDLVAGLRTRIITRVSTTANVDLTADLQNGDTLDGITLATNDKVLVKNQTDATENGIYDVVASGTATRNTDYNTVAKLAGQLVIVQEGTSNADTIYLCTTDSSGSIGSTNITFSQVQPQNVGTVTSVAVADSGSSEFTVTGSPITSSGTINLAVNSIAGSKITDAVVNDTTPQLGGNLDTNGNNINFGDNDIAQFGAGNDLQIYHDGTQSQIADVGTGALKIRATNLEINNSADSKQIIQGIDGGAVNLFHNGSIKLATTSTGVDVTGEVLADKAYIAETTLTDGATINWDMSTQSVCKVTLAGNRTMAAPTNGSTGQFASLLVIQDGTGSRTLTWNAVYEFASDTAPTLTTTASLGDLFVFRYNGTKWLEVGRNLALTLS